MLVDRQGQCKVVTRNVSRGESALKTNNKRVLLLCQNREGLNCTHGATIPDFSANPSCMSRIIDYFSSRIPDENIDEIAILSPSAMRVYARSQAKIIKEIAHSVAQFRKQVASLRKIELDPRCQDSRVCRRNWSEFTKAVGTEDYVTSDPIGAYIRLLAEKRSFSRRKEKDLKCCRDCVDSVERLRRTLLDTTLISKFLNLRLSYDAKEREAVYGHFFQPLVIPRVLQITEENPTGEFRRLEEYVIGPFTTRILRSPNSGENLYSVSSLADNDETLARIVEEVATCLRTFPKVTPKSARVLNLDELLRLRETEALRIVGARFPEIPQHTASSIAKLSCYESSGIGSIAPFLTDDKVEEFFVDQPGASVYLDHCKWGRCRTNIAPSMSELRRIETRLRAESGFRLDRLNPSLKTEITTTEFMIRASLDIPPLAVDGFHLDIRKLERSRFSLAALIRNGTLSLEAAAYLYLCLLRRRNIVAIGEPGSGKTTFINALDLLTPSYWRKIALEDAIESIPQRGLGKHQVRLKVEPLEERRRTLSKGKEIVSLLHRSPDLIYLGEIQTASHSRAMFHALSAGLTGLQTCHANSPEQAMIRWVVHHKIPVVCLCQIGIVVHLRKVGMSPEGFHRRKVVRICEVTESNDGGAKPVDMSSTSIQLVDVFKWNPLNDSLEQKVDLFQTPSIRSVAEYEAISRPIFEQELNLYKSLFQRLLERNTVDISTTTKTFDRISSRNTATSSSASML